MSYQSDQMKKEMANLEIDIRTARDSIKDEHVLTKGVNELADAVLAFFDFFRTHTHEINESVSAGCGCCSATKTTETEPPGGY